MAVCRNKKGRFTRCTKGAKRVSRKGRATGTSTSDRTRALRYWRELPAIDQDRLASQMATGSFHWSNWMDEEPSEAFLDQLEFISQQREGLTTKPSFTMRF